MLRDTCSLSFFFCEKNNNGEQVKNLSQNTWWFTWSQMEKKYKLDKIYNQKYSAAEKNRHLPWPKAKWLFVALDFR